MIDKSRMSIPPTAAQTAAMIIVRVVFPSGIAVSFSGGHMPPPKMTIILPFVSLVYTEQLSGTLPLSHTSVKLNLSSALASPDSQPKFQT